MNEQGRSVVSCRAVNPFDAHRYDRAERQSARMSKITNDGLTRSGTFSLCIN